MTERLPAEVVPVQSAPNWARDRFGIAEDELELRILRGALGCKHIGVSYMRFGPDWQLMVGHRHPGGEEVYVLVEGAARIKIDDDIFDMQAPSAIRVPGDRFRAIRAVGAPAVFVVAGWPTDDPDATEFDFDFWPRD